jgi:hypothetical protein
MRRDESHCIHFNFSSVERCPKVKRSNILTLRVLSMENPRESGIYGRRVYLSCQPGKRRRLRMSGQRHRNIVSREAFRSTGESLLWTDVPLATNCIYT